MSLGLLLGVGIPLTVFVLLGLFFFIAITQKRRKNAELALELRQTGERVVEGPGWARKREGMVSVVGSLLVTDRRLVFVGGFGGRTSIPFADITNVRRDRAFNGSRFSGLDWVVLTHRGSDREVGFLTKLTGVESSVRARHAA